MDNSCMQMWKASLKEANCSSEKQGSSGENAERSYRPSGGEQQRDGHHRDTDVMVERVSSTTEHSSLTVQNKQLRAKQIHSKTPDKNHYKSKLNKSRQSPLGEDYKSHRKKHKEKQSASRKDKVLHPHTSRKHLPIEEKRIDSEVSSSFVVSTPSLRSTTPPIRPGSSARASTRFSSSDSEPSVKSHHGKDVYASQPLSEEIKRLIKQECSTAEEDQQGTGEQEHYKRHRETGGNEEIHRNENKESNLYEKMVERKVREIRNNLERMSGKVSVSEEAVSESRHETRQKERQDSKKEDGEIYEHTNAESGHKRKRVRRKRRYEELTKPFVSSPCCSPPPRPANVTKYWSDADETENESDNETHLQHTNSVNIVLNFLKNNSNKYYASGRKVSTKSTNMKAKTKFKSSIKGRLSYPPRLASHQSRSKSDYGGIHPQAGNRRHRPMSPSEENHAGNMMRGHQPPARDHYGHSSRAHTPTMDEPSDHRDQRYKSPSGHRESCDGRRSSHLSDHRAAHYGRPPSPPDDPESFPRSRGSCSPPWPRDHKYRSPSQRNRENSRDRRSGSPRHGVRSFRDSCSPLKHRESLHRDGRSPSRLRGARDSSQYRKIIDENSRRNREFSPQSPERFSQERTASYPMKRLLSPSYPDYPVPSHAKHTRGFESPRSGSPRGSAEPHPRVNKQELGGVGPRSRSHHEKNVPSKRQLSRQESENSLPLEFGKGAKKARKLSDTSTTERILVTFENKEQQKKPGHFSGSMDHSLSPVSPPGDTDDYQKGIQFEAQRQITEQQKKTGHFSRSMDRSFSSPGDTDDYQKGIQFEAQRQRREQQKKTGHFSRSMDRSFSPPGDTDDYQKGLEFMSGEIQRQIREQQKKTGHFSRNIDHSLSPISPPDDYQKGLKLESGEARGQRREAQRQIREEQMKPGHFSGSIDHSLSPISPTGDTDEYQKGIQFVSEQARGQIREQQKKPGHFSGSIDRSLSPISPDDYQKGIKFASGEARGQIREGHLVKGSSTLVGPDLAVPQTAIKLDDGEPIIEWPEDYLNLSNTVSVYHRPSFVPDAQDRQKLDSLTKTCEVPRPLGITSMFSHGGIKKESLSHRLSDSEDDPKKVEVPTTVPRVCSPGTSLQAVSAEEATSNMVESSSTPEDTTQKAAGTEVNTTKQAAGTEVNTNKQATRTEVNTTKQATRTEVNTIKEATRTEVNTTKQAAGTEVNPIKEATRTEVNPIKEATRIEEKALLNLNPAEMSTLMTLIKLAKEHVATGKELPTNLSQVVGSGDGPNLKTPEPQGNQMKDSQQQQPSKSQISAGKQKRAANEENIKATINKSKNHSSDGGQSKEKDAVMNIKNYKIPKVRRDFDLNKKIDDNLSKSKGDDKPSQSKSKTDGSKKGKVSKGEKNYEKSPGRNVDEKSQERYKGKGHSSKDGGRKVDGKSHKKYKGKGHSARDGGQNVLETSQEKRKGKEQTSGDGGNVKETPSKKKMFRKDEAIRRSKSSPKPLGMERTFAEMQSVKVDLSVSPEAVSSRGKRCPKEGKLKRVGGRIYMNDSSDSDSDDSKLPEADNHPKAVHPLHRETIVLDHSVNSCLACEHSLCPDEFTSISLNTGTVTMRCRNCCTYTRMEKAMSLDYRNAVLSKPKNAVSKATDKVSHKKKDGKKRPRSSSSNKGTDSEKSELDAIDPSLFVFPWTSSRNRKKVHEDLLFNDNSNSTDSDEFRRKLQQEKKPINKRKSSSPKKRPHHVGKETSKHSSKPTSVDKPCSSAKDNTTTKSSDAGKISSHTKYADDTNPKAKVRKIDALFEFPMITKRSTVPVITKPTIPVITKPTTVPMITKPTIPVITKPTTVPMITKPTTVPMITKPTTVPMITKPTTVPMITKPTTVPMITKPTIPMITKPTTVPMITKPTVPMITKPSTAPTLATATNSPTSGTAFKSTTHPKTSLTRGLREQRFF